MIRVVIADDHEMVREGLRLILGTQPDIEVVAEVGDGRAALDACVRLLPDVCLLDIQMPGLDGLSAAEEFASADWADAPAIVVVTTFANDENVDRALRAGVRGFVTKDSGSVALLQAVRAASCGDGSMSPDVTGRLLDRVARHLPERVRRIDLTARELDVLGGIGEGLTNRQLASRDSVSLSTIKAQVASLMVKLNIANRVGLAVFAHHHGITTNTDARQTT
jgi:DNA-binding NarL/FixJ family response regulator